MATGRIDGENRYPGLDRLLPRTGPVKSGALTPIEPAPVAESEPAGYLDLDTLVEVAGQRAVTPPSPHRCVADFAEPQISDPTIFQGNRPLSILERLASDIIPMLGDNEELRSLAGTIIADEIERHRQLAGRIHGGIVS
jgi:hypothetical protein